MNQEEVIRVLGAHFPKEIWFVPIIILFVLGVLAAYDAVTGRVPGAPMSILTGWAIGLLWWYSGWQIAADRLAHAVFLIAALWLGNELYVKFAGRDAYGFGDAKWSGVALIGFGMNHVFVAWIVGAWIAVFWLSLRWVSRKIGSDGEFDSTIHFVPFLFVGLLLSLFRQACLT